jgi:folate-dependent tRNA-U54 methylase TrmFO/GidA
MNDEKKFDKTVINFVIGGAVLGAIAGYVVKKIGVRNILNILKSKKIISSSIADTITEFTTSNDLSEEDE